MSARRDRDRPEEPILIAKVYLPLSLAPPRVDSSDDDDSDDESAHVSTSTTVSIRIEKDTTVRDLKELCIHKMKSFASSAAVTPIRTPNRTPPLSPASSSPSSPRISIISNVAAYTLMHHISPFVSVPEEQKHASAEVVHVDIPDEIVVSTLYRPGLTQHAFDLELRDEYKHKHDHHHIDHVQHNGLSDIIEVHGMMAYDGRFLFSDGSTKLTLDADMGYRTSYKIENGPYGCIEIKDYSGLYVAADVDGGVFLTSQVSDAALWMIEDDHYFKHFKSGCYLTTGSAHRSVSKSTVHVEKTTERPKEFKWKMCGPVVEGELQKKAHTGFRPWQRRYFRITGLYLVYWHSKEDAKEKKKPKSEYPLDEIKAVTITNNKKHQFRIQFKHKNHDRMDLELMCDTSEDQTRWTRALQDEGIHLHHQLTSAEPSLSKSQTQREETVEEKSSRLEKERIARGEQEKAEKERAIREAKERALRNLELEKEHEAAEVQRAKQLLQESKVKEADETAQKVSRRAERRARRDAELAAAGILSPNDIKRTDTDTPPAIVPVIPSDSISSPSNDLKSTASASVAKSPRRVVFSDDVTEIDVRITEDTAPATTESATDAAATQTSDNTTSTNPSSSDTNAATTTTTTTAPTFSMVISPPTPLAENTKLTTSIPAASSTVDEELSSPDETSQTCDNTGTQVELTSVGQVRRTDATTKDPNVLHERITDPGPEQHKGGCRSWFSCCFPKQDHHIQFNN